MPVLVRNLEGGPTVFTDEAKKVHVEWQGAGDQNGEDVQQVPDDFVNNVNFLKAVNRGIFKIEEASPEVLEALEKQGANWRDRQQAAANASVDAIDQQANNDLIGVPCIGPNNRGSGECGEPTMVKEKARNEQPPLCSRHQSLKSQYFLTETEKLVDGKAEQVWKRAIQTARETQQV